MGVEREQYNWFKPDDIEVGTLKTSAPIEVKFSRFSVPKEYLPPGYRGIADIDLNSEDPDAEVILRVRILRHEENYKIRLLKDGIWIEKPTNFDREERGIWIGFLEAVIRVGDPPIAVG